MISWDHEGIVSLFRNNRRLAAELLKELLGQELPEYSEVEIEDGDKTQRNPAELRADLVLSLRHRGESVLAIILEVQRERDEAKRHSWPGYVASGWYSLKCPVCLLVVTPSESVARWAAKTIDLGPSGKVRPLVIPPSGVPLVTEPEEAKQAPELSVFSVVAHGRGEVDRAVEIALAAAAAAEGLGPDRFLLYLGLILSSLSEEARKAFLMHSQGVQFFHHSQQESYDKGKAEGTAASKAAAVVTVLEARGLSLSDEQRERLSATTDLSLLDEWIRRAATIQTTEELFRE